MARPHLKLLAIVVLGAHLSPLGLPALCPASRSRGSADCGSSLAAPAGAPAVSGVTDHAPCPNQAFCAVMPTAMPSFGTVAVGVTAARRAAGPTVVAAQPRDPPPPLSPPPQA